MRSSSSSDRSFGEMKSSSSSDRSFGETRSSSSAARPGGTFEYDVFLSFRGKDTRKGFTGNLYDRLKLLGISAFMDSEHLPKGQYIMELMNYIQRSKIFLAILSKGYAESSWCLREITMMVKCGRLIIPVFFDVEPSDVRGDDQHGKHFAPEFTRYQNDMEMNQQEVVNWRHALMEVGRKSGFHLKNDTDGDEAKLIRLILKRVLSEVNKFPYPVAEHPIGVDDHVQAVKKLRNNDSQVQFIGIHGMGGIGKTTIAKAIYNDLFLDFEASVILFQIRERFQRKKEIEVQGQLIREILKNKDPVYTIEDGKRMIINKMKSKRVLIILDDIDDREQLDALAGGRDWFGPGSMIIIITRNRKVLMKHGLDEDQIYKVPCLDSVRSRYLFKWYAFKGREQTRGCLPLLDAFLKACGGIPLALQVIGSTLFSTRIEEWKELLERLQAIPEELDDIQKILRVSYDGLSETQKQIFLDISCFFIGKDREKATHMWKACRYHPEGVIEVLLNRSLVNIDHRGEFSMHVLIRDMGRKIVLQQGETEPWKRSRLWSSLDISDQLRRTVSNELVNGIMLEKNRNDFVEDEQRSNLERCFDSRWFDRVHNLRILRLENISFEGNFDCFPKNLRWLALEDCRFTSPPRDFDLDEVVVLDMSGCSILPEHFTNMGTGKQATSNLKFLNLSRTKIRRTPDFTKTPSLEQLILSDCTELTDIHESIGKLKKLSSLDIQGCSVLSKIPDSVCELTSLKSFDLRNCGKVSLLPDSLGNVKSLEELYLDGTSIETLPDSIGNLTSLRTLSLKSCVRLKTLPGSFRQLIFLKNLIVQETLFVEGQESKIRYEKEAVEVDASSVQLLAVLPDLFCGRICSLSLTDHTIEELPDCVRRMINLRSLKLDCDAIIALPSYIGSLRRIENLDLQCERLESLPDSLSALKELVTIKIKSRRSKAPPDCLGVLENLEELYSRCGGLTTLPHDIGDLRNLRELWLECNNLEELPTSIASLRRLQKLWLFGCWKITTLSVAFEGQQDMPQHSASSQDLYPKTTEEGWHTCIVQVPSSLLLLEVADCVLLERIDVQNLRSLKHLEVKGCLNLRRLDVSNLQSLQHLEVEGNEMGKLKVSKLQSLQHLKVKGLRKLNVSNLQSLMHLEVEGNEMDKLKVSKLQSLQHLKVKGLTKLNVSNLQSLMHLEAEGMDELKVSKLQSLQHLEIMHVKHFKPSKLQSLQHLEMKLCTDVTSLDVSKLQSLMHLELHSRYRLKEIKLNLQSLQHLGVDDCRSLTRLDVSKLQSLMHLELHSCYRLKEINVLNLQSLQHLGVEDCRSLTRLDVSKLQSLMHLEVNSCSQLEEINVLNLQSLQYLGVKNCQKIKRLDISSLQSLQHLDVHSCYELGEVNVFNLQSVKVLSIKDCPLLDDIPGLENITEELEHLGLPAPACALSDKLKERCFKRAAFPSLRSLLAEGDEDNPRLVPFLRESIVPTSTEVAIESTLDPPSFLIPATSWVRRGRLPFLLPNVPHANRRLKRALFTFCHELRSPVHVSVIADDGRPVFEATRDLRERYPGDSDDKGHPFNHFRYLAEDKATYRLHRYFLYLDSHDEVILQVGDIPSGTIQLAADIRSFSAHFQWDEKA